MQQIHIWTKHNHIDLCIYASGNQVSIGSDNGLSPVWRQAITWNNAGLLSIRPLEANFSEILIKAQNFNSRNAIENVICQNGDHFVQEIS